MKILPFQKVKLGTISCLAMLLSFSCTHQTQYHWGTYEDMVYGSFQANEDSEPVVQVQKLTEDLQKADAAGKQVGPGFYAHLGYMQHLSGDDVGAIDSFKREKELYPQSKKFVDRLIKGLTGQETTH